MDIPEPGTDQQSSNIQATVGLDAIEATIHLASNPIVMLGHQDELLAWNTAWQTLLSTSESYSFQKGERWEDACKHARFQLNEMDSCSSTTPSNITWLRLADGRYFDVFCQTINAITLVSCQESTMPGAVVDKTDLDHPWFDLVNTTDTPGFIRQKDRLITVNDAFVRFLGYRSRAELMEHNRVSDHFPVEIRDTINEIHNAGALILDSDDLRMLNREGVPLNAYPLGHDFTINGVIHRAVFMRDYSAQASAEKKLRESEDRFRDFAQCGADWFWEVDADLRLSHISYFYRAIPGINTKDLLGLTRREFLLKLSGDNAIVDFGELDDIQRRREPINNFDYRVWYPDGEEVTILLNAIPMFDPNGEFKGYRGASRDITYQKNIEKSLVKAKERAEKHSIAKSEFLASISHELRTPLTNILGYLELLRRKAELDQAPLNPEQQRSVDIIWKNGDHLRSLINNVISIERLESGDERIDVDSIDIVELLEDVSASFSISVSLNNNTLSVQANRELPDQFHSDITKLRQILHNLVGNAVSHTENGQIDVWADSFKGGLRIHIRDTGTGITQDYLQRLKPPLSSDEVSRSLENGQGLGLLLSVLYVERLEGEITFQSEPDKGTEIVLLLPDLAEYSSDTKAKATRQPSHSAIPQPDTPNTNLVRDCTTLVVDDNQAHCELLVDLLKPLVTTISTADNGIAALELFQKLQPDVVFMDLRMPQMDGREATRMIRKLEADRALDGENLVDQSACRIVAVTADGFADSTELLVESGFDAFITKPYSASEITFQLAQGTALKSIAGQD